MLLVVMRVKLGVVRRLERVGGKTARRRRQDFVFVVVLIVVGIGEGRDHRACCSDTRASRDDESVGGREACESGDGGGSCCPQAR